MHQDASRVVISVDRAKTWRVGCESSDSRMYGGKGLLKRYSKRRERKREGVLYEEYHRIIRCLSAREPLVILVILGFGRA